MDKGALNHRLRIVAALGTAQPQASAIFAAISVALLLSALLGPRIDKSEDGTDIHGECYEAYPLTSSHPI